MLDWLARLLQFVITWSQFLGLLTAPAALLCFAVGALRRGWRSNAAYWGMILLWPWHVYVWAVGIAICFSAWGWWGLLGLFLLAVIGLRGKAAWIGIVLAFMRGQPELGASLLVICAALLAAKFVAGWLLVHSPEAVAEPSESN